MHKAIIQRIIVLKEHSHVIKHYYLRKLNVLVSAEILRKFYHPMYVILIQRDKILLNLGSHDMISRKFPGKY